MTLIKNTLFATSVIAISLTGVGVNAQHVDRVESANQVMMDYHNPGCGCSTVMGITEATNGHASSFAAGMVTNPEDDNVIIFSSVTSILTDESEGNNVNDTNNNFSATGGVVVGEDVTLDIEKDSTNAEAESIDL